MSGSAGRKIQLITASRIGTAAGWLGTMYFTVDYRGGATYSGLNKQCAGSTVPGTGAAFHTGIPVPYHRFSFFDVKNCMGTNLQAHTAAVTLFRIQSESYHIFQIYQRHGSILLIQPVRFGVPYR